MEGGDGSSVGGVCASGSCVALRLESFPRMNREHGQVWPNRFPESAFDTDAQFQGCILIDLSKMPTSSSNLMARVAQ